MSLQLVQPQKPRLCPECHGDGIVRHSPRWWSVAAVMGADFVRTLDMRYVMVTAAVAEIWVVIIVAMLAPKYWPPTLVLPGWYLVRLTSLWIASARGRTEK
jgi:hypothetical protein